MKDAQANALRWTLAGTTLVIAAGLLFVNLRPTDVIGPEPDGGFDETPADYNVPQYPDAPVVPVPVFGRDQLSAVPFSISFLDMPPGRDVAVVGKIVHPNTTVTGSLVRLGFYERPRPGESEGRRRGGFQGFAEGEGGRLAYRIEGQTPKTPGVYDVRIEVDHPILDEDVDELPVDERMTTTLIAEGQVVIRN
jgi:hypothetical protein